MTYQQGVVDKTDLFLRLQEELRSGRVGESPGVKGALHDAGKIIAPYFENAERLSEFLAHGALTYEATFLRQYQHIEWVHAALKTMLAEFRAARDADADTCFETWGRWMEPIDYAMRNTTNVAHLETAKTELSPELLAKSCLRDAGDMVEGSLQPFVRLRLEMRGVAGNREKHSTAVASMSLGSVIAELATVPHSSQLYCPPPYRLSISQWRNIANHNSYVVYDDEVVCKYGKPGRLRSLRCPVSYVIDLAKYINDLCFVHKIAFEIFSIDNISELNAFAPELVITEHTTDGALAYGLVAAGFTIKKVGRKPGKWMLVLVDEHSRREWTAKNALQDATVAYALLSGSTEIAALVQSDTESA